jgi:Domain of unknown function (DUF4381)
MNEDLSGLDLIALLDRLESIPEPPTVSLWPQTEAWVWVGLAVLVVFVWLIRRVRLCRRANAYRRAALREIAAAGDSHVAVAEILRRTALVAFPRAEVAGLHGEDWLAFLDRTGGGGTEFCEGEGRVLARAPYSAEEVDAKQLAILAARWVRRHRPLLERES